MPLITGQTPNVEREDLYDKFRRGEVRHLILSKVGNFAIDLPDANVLIQVSGTFGSRQEEAQRLGRILRPKAGGEVAHFYTLVTRDTREHGLRPPPPDVPDRAGLQLPDRRRRRPRGQRRSQNRLNDAGHPGVR